MKRLAAISVGILVVAFVSQAYADDLNPPEWRGEDGTTYQRWEFSTAENPAAPEDDVFNPYGDSSAFVEGEFPFTRWKEEDFGHFGVWTFEDFILLDIPNSPIPNEFKHIWLQVTFTAADGLDPEFVSVPGSSFEVIDKFMVDDFYWHGTYLLTIEPNPDGELIYVMPRDCTLYVDEIVVDTICAPEPASLMLLTLAGLLIRRR